MARSQAGKWEGECYAYMGLPLGWFSSHEGVGQSIFRPTFPVTGFVVAFKLAGAPAVVKGAITATLLTQLHIIIDHLIWICMNLEKELNYHDWIYRD